MNLDCLTNLGSGAYLRRERVNDKATCKKWPRQGGENYWEAARARERQPPAREGPPRTEAGRTARGSRLPAEVRAAQGDPDKEAAGPPSTPPPAPRRTRT